MVHDDSAMYQIGTVLKQAINDGDLFLEIEGEKLIVDNEQTLITNQIVCPPGSREAYGTATYCGEYIFNSMAKCIYGN